MAFVYRDDLAYIKYNKFLYKSKLYQRDKVIITVNNKKYFIDLIQMNKFKFKMFLTDIQTKESLVINEKNEMLDYVINDIEEISDDKLNEQFDHPDSVEYNIGILIYIFVMIFSVIFKGWIIVWIIASILFKKWITNKTKFHY